MTDEFWGQENVQIPPWKNQPAPQLIVYKSQYTSTLPFHYPHSTEILLTPKHHQTQTGAMGAINSQHLIQLLLLPPSRFLFLAQRLSSLPPLFLVVVLGLH